jgi:tungstate transport system ATP-binding protein
MSVGHLSDLLPLSLRGLSFTAGGRRLLGPLETSVAAPGVSVILGPNGAGKSLLLRLLHGLLPPSAGALDWNGAAPAAARRRQAFVFQRPLLLRRSALRNVTYALALAGVPRRQRRPRALAALQAAGVAGLAQRPARVLSGGEQQRVALARALATEPAVVLLDEATANLDPAATRAVEAVVLRLRADGVKVIMATHDLGQARRLADEILFLDRGRLLEQAPAAAFFAGPRSPAARRFLAGELPLETGESP